MNVSSVNSASNIETVDADKVGFSGLTSDDFLKLLISQLQNQDPTNPLDSDALLSQISEMRGLQASLELESALENLTLSQSLSSSTAFIGKTVVATHGDNNESITGVVDRVQIRDSQAYLTIDGTEVELKNVLSVAA
jgi:flagellar basal-body rod modification protein FlgD